MRRLCYVVNSRLVAPRMLEKTPDRLARVERRRLRCDGSALRAPGIGDDTGNVVALLEALHALNRAGIKTKGDLIFVASTQEELRLKGAKYWLNRSGYQPDMFVALKGSV